MSLSVESLINQRIWETLAISAWSIGTSHVFQNLNKLELIKKLKKIRLADGA